MLCEDHNDEKNRIRELDDRMNRLLFGRPLHEMSPLFQTFHQHVSLVDVAAQIRQQQQQEEKVEESAASPKGKLESETSFKDQLTEERKNDFPKNMSPA